MMKFRFYGYVGLILLVFAAKARAQIEVNIFDFDGTLLENRQIREGTFNPKFILYRNEQRLNLLQIQASGPKTVHVTEQDLYKFRAHLALGEGQPGTVGREYELLDGTKIKPGEYYVRYPDSLAYFREGTDRNHLLDAFIQAETKSPEGRWKGPLWNDFAELASTEDGAKTISILTARGHSSKEWEELFDYLIERKHIKFKPDLRRIFNVTRPEFDKYSNHGGAAGQDPVDVPNRKANIVYEILMKLARTPTGSSKLHTVRVADDDLTNLQRIASVFQKVAFGNQSPVRMILINAGLSTQIRSSGRPEFSVIEPGSGIFKSIPRDQVFADRRAPRTCDGLFVSSAATSTGSQGANP